MSWLCLALFYSCNRSPSAARPPVLFRPDPTQTPHVLRFHWTVLVHCHSTAPPAPNFPADSAAVNFLRREFPDQYLIYYF